MGAPASPVNGFKKNKIIKKGSLTFVLEDFVQRWLEFVVVLPAERENSKFIFHRLDHPVHTVRAEKNGYLSSEVRSLSLSTKKESRFYQNPRNGRSEVFEQERGAQPTF